MIKRIRLEAISAVREGAVDEIHRATSTLLAHCTGHGQDDKWLVVEDEVWPERIFTTGEVTGNWKAKRVLVYQGRGEEE